MHKKKPFSALLKCPGVGPKMALGILSTLSIDLLIHTVENEDINTPSLKFRVWVKNR